MWSLALWFAGGGGQVAYARDESCPELYNWQFRALIASVDEDYLKLDFGHAQRALDAANPRVPCILELVQTKDLAAYAIRKAYAYALDLDENEALRWAKLARALDPKIDWPDYVPQEHSVRQLLEGVEPAESVTAEGKGLALPQSGGAFLDGRFLETPTAESGVPHLLQIGDAVGEFVYSGWIDGATFPDAYLGPPLAEPPKLPKWYSPDGRIKRAPRPWTDSRLHRLESSFGFAVAAGAMYATALLAHTAYDERPTDGLFYTTNGATLASGAAGTVSVVLFGAALFGK